MQIPIVLDRTRPEGLSIQIASQIRDGIRTGRLTAGVRLPSSRRLAEQLEVSRNTVVRAYEVLEEEDYVIVKPASGIYAAPERPETILPPSLPSEALPIGDAAPAMPLPSRPLRAQRLVNPSGGRLSFDYFPGRPGAGLFPIKAWRRLIQSCLGQGGALGLSQYSDPCGLPALRTRIAGVIASSRGIVADPGQIIITTGIQEGLSIMARLFLEPGRNAVIENPCYQGANFALEATGAEITRVPVDDDGLVVEDLPRNSASLVYTTPSHQYPVGSTLSMERREALISWARRTGCYILEDDYDGDFRHDGSPLRAIASMAPDCTVYFGTFSKSLGAGLRLGFLVVPPPLIEPVRAAKTLLNNGNSWLDQAVLCEFIASGSYVSHIMRCRVQYRENRDILIQALRSHFGDVEYSGEAAGLHILWQLPQGMPEASLLETVARKARIGIYSLASGGAYDGLGSELMKRGVLLGYSSMTPKQIEKGIAKLSDAVDDTLDMRPEFVEELLVSEPLPLSRARRPAPTLRNKPALHAARPHRAVSLSEHLAEDRSVMQAVSAIYRYPVKGLGPQPVETVTLEAGKPFPFDRVFALARPGVLIDQVDPKWAKKGLFVMLMLDEALASVATDLDPQTLVMTVNEPGGNVLRFDFGTESGRDAVEGYFANLAPSLRGKPQLVQSRCGHFMDKPDNVLSLINLETVRSLENQWGFDIDPLRFRANFYIDGIEPWREFEWIGSDVRIGDAVFRVDRRNGRCGATNVNPANGARDLDIPRKLRATFGHKDLGVYLAVRQSGRVSVGDPVAVPNGYEISAQTVPSAVPQAKGAGRYICRGCYYIHDPKPGDGSPAVEFADLPVNWVCPDCGTDKSAFRIYVPG